MNDYLEHNNLKNLKEDKEIERKIQLILRVGKVLMESGADTNRIVRNMKCLKRHAVFLCRFLYLRHPIIGERALVGIIEDKTRFADFRMSGTIFESWLLRILCKGQVHEVDPTFRYIRDFEAFILQKFRIS